LDNGLLRAAVDRAGHVTSLRHLPTGREAIAPGLAGNSWVLHPDHPIEYDAWDIEAYDRRTTWPLPDAAHVEVVDDGSLLVAVRISRPFGESTLVETVSLRAGSPRLDVAVDLDWQERHRLLKVAWPIDVLT